jgi:hypothetical protein
MLASGLAVLSGLGGCVAFEIRDSVRETNARLCELTPALGHTLHAIEDTRVEVERTRGLLLEVQADIRDVRGEVALVRSSLDRTDGSLTAVGSTLGETNPKLNRVDGGLDRLAVLDRLAASLEKTNKALEPLASAAGLIGTLETGLGMVMGEGTHAAAPTSEPAASDSNANAPAAPLPNAPVSQSPAPPPPARPDPLLGTWVLVYPAPSPPAAASSRPDAAAAPPASGPEARDVLILRPDNTYLSAAGGTPPQTGTWTRVGRTLTLTLPPPAPPTPPAPPAPAVPAASPPPGAEYELLTLTTRTLTIRSGDTVRVYARP